MNKILKIILAVIAVLLIAFFAFVAVIFLDVAAYTATGIQTLTPQGTSMGTALVLYDPGLSGASTKVAQQIASDLQNLNLTVTLAGIKSSAATDITGYSIVVVGGPIYAGTPTSSVKDALGSMQPSNGTLFGVYGSGQGATSPEDKASIKDSVPALQSGGALQNAVVVKIGEGEDIAARSADFVAQLIG